MQKRIFYGGGGGSGGGAPFGLRYPNFASASEFFEKFGGSISLVPYEKSGQYLSAIFMRALPYDSFSRHGKWVDAGNQGIITDLPNLNCAIEDSTNFSGERWMGAAKDFYYTLDDSEGVYLQSQDAGLDSGGNHGYSYPNANRVTYKSNGLKKSIPVSRIKNNHGGNGWGCRGYA